MSRTLREVVFVDGVRALDEPDAAPLVAVSQGVHLVLPRRFLPGDCAVMVPQTDDGRVPFAVPWHDRVIVGTTDTPLERAAEEGELLLDVGELGVPAELEAGHPADLARLLDAGVLRLRRGEGV